MDSPTSCLPDFPRMSTSKTVWNLHDYIPGEGRRPFYYFALPLEIRLQILSYLLPSPQTLDLDPTNHRLLARLLLPVFLTSRRLHFEASRLFYRSTTIRIFPTHGRFFGHKIMPLLARLGPRYRRFLTSLELRLGPGWSDPPRSWSVNDRLGLEEMKNVRLVKVFVECDPSRDIFKSFRVGRDFFTNFAARLLEEILKRLPGLVQVEFDAWPSVMREGPLMRKLVEVAKGSGNTIAEISAERSFQKRMIAHLSKTGV